MIAGMMNNETTTKRKRTKRKVITSRCPSSVDGQLLCLMDKDTFKPIEPLPPKDATNPQIVASSKVQHEICGFLSHGFIIPLVGLIPGHENLQIEDAHEKLSEEVAKMIFV